MRIWNHSMGNKNNKNKNIRKRKMGKRKNMAIMHKNKNINVNKIIKMLMLLEHQFSIKFECLTNNIEMINPEFRGIQNNRGNLNNLNVH